MSIAARFDELTPREQRLLALLALVAATIAFVAAPAYVYMGISEAREDNQKIRKLLGRMDRSAMDLARLRAKREAVEKRYDKPSPALRSFIESVARANALEVAEATDQAPIESKGFVERITKVRLRKVNLKPLMLMLQAIERSGNPIAITGLRISKRASGADVWDVQLAVSGYEKSKGAPAKSKKKAAKKSRGKSR